MSDTTGRTSGRFQKRPVEVEAIRYQPGPDGNCEAVATFVGYDWPGCEDDCSDEVWMVEAANGWVDAEPGDWIVKQVLPDGSEDVWPVAAAVFEQTYEPAPVLPEGGSDE